EFHINARTVRKSASTGTTTIGVGFTNSGTVATLEGTANFNNGSLLSGIFSAGAGTTINFNGGPFSYDSSLALNGPGAIRLSGGSLTLINDVPPNLTLAGGTVTLGPSFQGGTITNLNSPGSALSGNYTVTGTLNLGNGLSGSLHELSGATVNWSGGNITGSGI